jgi:hypothetical protein
LVARKKEIPPEAGRFTAMAFSAARPGAFFVLRQHERVFLGLRHPRNENHSARE